MNQIKEKSAETAATVSGTQRNTLHNNNTTDTKKIKQDYMGLLEDIRIDADKINFLVKEILGYFLDITPSGTWLQLCYPRVAQLTNILLDYTSGLVSKINTLD